MPHLLSSSLCREFGYVARDQLTKKHKCHVFRCDMPARAVAKALLENHQKMSTKSLSSVPMTTTENGHTPPEQRRAGLYIHTYVYISSCTLKSSHVYTYNPP